MKLLFLILSLLVANSLQNYQPNLSKALWRASSLSYFDKSDINNMNCGAPCDDLKGFQLSSQYNTQIAPGQPLSYSVFYNKEQHKAIFAFKGSHDLIQIANELPGMGSKKYDLHNIPNAQATDYFYSNYKNFLRDNVLKETKKMKAQCPQCDFYFTGHSLGGALTTLGALDVSMSGIVDKKKLHMYTYGSPRVGNGNFAEAVNKHVPNSYRVVHNNDVVPHFPPCKKDKNHQCIHSKDSSSHVGTEVYYHDAKNPHKFELCKKPEDPNCSGKHFRLISGIGDHSKYLGLERDVSKDLKDAKKKQPTHPTHPTHPKRPTHPGKTHPLHPTRPVHPNKTHPDRPTHPTHPTKLRPNGTHPIRPIHPIHPIRPTHPTHPAHPTKLRPNRTHPTHPTTRPIHPTTKPTSHPTHPTKPAHPATPTRPTIKPTHPTTKPTPHPIRPVHKPTPHPVRPTAKPTQPTHKPAPHPVHKPTPHPVHKPAPQPVHKPQPAPRPQSVHKPAPQPVHKPTPQPVHKPAPQPVRKPAPQPVHKPTPRPTHH